MEKNEEEDVWSGAGTREKKEVGSDEKG